MFSRTDRRGFSCLKFLFTFLLVLISIGAASFGTTARAAVGRTPGTFVVSPTGAATYTIPIWSPPGPRGVQPKIALSYNSGSGNGYVGVGWSLSGLSSIYRCNQTYAQDGVPGAVALTDSDVFCMDGQRLRLTAGTYGTAGSTYQTEVANFSLVTAYGSAGNGPAYFSVQGSDGITYEYGYTDGNGNGANSQVLASGTPTADAWLLSKVVDPAGNNFVINYTTLTGLAVPNKILWTPTSAGASTYTYEMDFHYVTNAPQSSVYGYIAGTPFDNTELLSSVVISASGAVVKDYFLDYQISPTTSRERLQTVTE